MPIRKKFDPSWNFSATILGIGAISLICALLFSSAMENVRMAASAAQMTCSGGLEICMRSAEKNLECHTCIDLDATIKTTSCQTCAASKALCQNGYNACTDQGGKIYAW